MQKIILDTILGKLNKAIPCDGEIRVSDIETTFSADDLQLLIFGGGACPPKKEQEAYKRGFEAGQPLLKLN